MHAGTAPVVRLEGPLALGHDVLLVVSGMPSGRPRFRESSGDESCCWPARSPGTGASVAAVSPTFGRLFEGTDERSLGQTWSAATEPTDPSAARRRKHTLSAAPLRHDIRSERRTAPRNPNEADWNAAELLAAARKTVNFGQCRFRVERRSTTKRGWRIN
jgi:hypothetical protein